MWVQTLKAPFITSLEQENKKDTWVHISFVTFGWLFFCKKNIFYFEKL